MSNYICVQLLQITRPVPIGIAIHILTYHAPLLHILLRLCLGTYRPPGLYHLLGSQLVITTPFHLLLDIMARIEADIEALYTRIAAIEQAVIEEWWIEEREAERRRIDEMAGGTID